MTERRTVFEHNTEKPTVVSWAEISSENEQGWRQYYIAFGLGSGAIRGTQVQFDGGEWSQPIVNGISMAGGIEASLHPDMEDWEVRHTLRAFWEPAERFRALTLNDPTRLFGGNFAHSTGNERQYFTNTADTWSYLAEQFEQHGVLQHLPAVYYGLNLSQATQLSAENQMSFGPLAGDFTVPEGHISKITAKEHDKLADESARLIQVYTFIDELRTFAGHASTDAKTEEAVNTLIQAARRRAEGSVVPGSIVLDTSGFAPFSDFRYDSKEVVDRQQTVAAWQEALLRLQRSEAELF